MKKLISELAEACAEKRMPLMYRPPMQSIFISYDKKALHPKEIKLNGLDAPQAIQNEIKRVKSL